MGEKSIRLDKLATSGSGEPPEEIQKNSPRLSWSDIEEYDSRPIRGPSAPRFELTTEFSNKQLSMATALIKGYERSSTPSSSDLYQERIRRIIDAQVNNRVDIHPAPTSSTSRAPDLMEQIRLSLAQIESKKLDANPSKKPARKAPNVAKKKRQRARA